MIRISKANWIRIRVIPLLLLVGMLRFAPLWFLMARSLHRLSLSVQLNPTIPHEPRPQSPAYGFSYFLTIPIIDSHHDQHDSSRSSPLDPSDRQRVPSILRHRVNVVRPTRRIDSVSIAWEGSADEGVQDLPMGQCSRQTSVLQPNGFLPKDMKPDG